MQYCSDCKHNLSPYNVTWLMHKEDCELNIKRESPEGLMFYSDCDQFEQADQSCPESCKWCLWKEKDQTCAIHKYPKRIIKCAYYQKPSKNVVTWSVQCTPRGYYPDGVQFCQCFVVGNDPKAIYKLQLECIQRTIEDYDFEPSVPTKFSSITIDQFKKKINCSKRSV